MIGEAAAVGEVAPRRVDVEQVYYLDVPRACYGLTPVGIEDVSDCPVFVRRRKSAVASLLAQQAHKSAIKREQNQTKSKPNTVPNSLEQC